MNGEIEGLRREIGECDIEAGKLNADIEKLKEESGPIVTDIRMVGPSGEDDVQQILDHCELNHEVIYFKDNKSNTWLLKKRPNIDL
ncbi:MAG: hypothetical protein V2I33_19445 [Kangiellaceae bacterium]|nr:hypothetical protein [Kangiellaceae bacterium]